MFTWLKRRSIDVILNDFHKAASRLEFHAEFMRTRASEALTKAVDLRVRATAAEAQAERHKDEAKKAEGIAAKIKDLVS